MIIGSQAMYARDGKFYVTRSLLADILFDRRPTCHTFYDTSGRVYVGVLESIQREDGSGKSFNITINQGGSAGSVTFYVRTID